MVGPGHPGHGDARTIRCAQCGALVPVALPATEATCAHCGLRQRLDPRLMGGLHQYQQQVARDLQSAQEHYAQAAQMHASEQQVRKPAAHYVLAYGLMIGIPTLVAFGGGFALREGYLTQDQAPLIAFGSIGAAMVGMVLYFVVSSLGGRRGTRTAAAGGTTVACPSCGAAHSLQHGQVLERCTYCGAALMPTATVMQAGLDAARSARRHAELERWRKERSLVATYQGMGMSGTAVVVMATVPMILMVGAGAVAFSWQMATGVEPYSPGIFALWALFFGVIAVLVLSIWWTRHRKGQLRAACEALAAQLRGYPFESIQQMVHWLNEHWAGPYESRYLSGVGLYGGAMGVMEGYAVLAEFFGTSDRYRQPRLHLLVAAWIPGLSDGAGHQVPNSPAVVAEKQALAQAGLHVELNRGGLLLTAEPYEVKRIRKDLSQLGQLAPVLARATRLARAMGAQPVGRTPYSG